MFLKLKKYKPNTYIILFLGIIAGFIALIPVCGVGAIMYLTLWMISPMIELKKRKVEEIKLDDEDVIVENKIEKE